MITNDRQLKVTAEKINSLLQSLDAKPNPKAPEQLVKAARIQTESVINDLKAEVLEYRSLKEKGLAAIQISRPEDVFLLPIKYRIAKNLTQEQFANLVNVPLRMIARYESEHYSNINAENLQKILARIQLVINNGRISESA